MENGKRNGDDETQVEVGMLDTSVAMTAVDRASIDMQIATAKQYPRSIDSALKEAEGLAVLDEETAASCFYVLPRAGKNIEGPSARLAEIMAYSWGNLRVDADLVGEDATHVTAMGTCFDLEKNVAIRVRVKRRITNQRGQRFNADMIGVTSNAAISIALRNCVFKVIPAALTQRIYQKARKASIGEGGTTTQKRQNAVEWFTKTGISDENLYALLGVNGIDDIGVDELITLRGLKTAIKDGETSVEMVLRSLNDDQVDAEQMAARTVEQTAKLKKMVAEATERKAAKAAEKKAEEESKPTDEPPPVDESEDERAAAEDRKMAEKDG